MIADSAPRWFAGEQIVIAWPDGIALVDGTVGLAVAERIWARLRRDSQLGTFLKTLSEGSSLGFLDLPPFAIAVRDLQRYHLAVRGSLSVEVHIGEHVETLSGEGITTWAERVIPEPAAIRLGVCEADSDGVPLVDGVVVGGAITIGEPRAVAALPVAPQTSVSESPPAEAPATESPEVEPPNGVANTTLAELDEIESADHVESEVMPEPASPPRPESLAVPANALPPSGVGSAEVQSPGNPYDSLWDKSIALDIEAAAIREEDEELGAVQGSPPAPDLGAELSGAVSAEQLSGDTVADEGSVVVSMPGASRQPQVLARFCDRDHANPPERASCFVCGAAVSGDARMAARPQLGWLRVEGGETIPLRGPIIAGRNPRSTALTLSESPRLVALPHPHVSGTHLAILIEGWRLMARDLNSSNGTFLRRHGEPPVRLPEAPVPLVPGDLIDLGKGLFLHLERTP